LRPDCGGFTPQVRRCQNFLALAVHSLIRLMVGSDAVHGIVNLG